MKREYGISKEDLYLNYSWDQIQDFLMNLPPDRIINLDGQKLSKTERKTKFMEALYDRDETTVKTDLESYQSRIAKLEQRLEEKNGKKTNL